MARYEGWARSNYFKVRDEKEFEKFCDALNMRVINNDKGMVGFAPSATEDGGFSFRRYDKELGKYVEVDFDSELSKHLEESQVAIYMEIGHQKLQFLAGYAVAVNWKGDSKIICLDDIYQKATNLAPDGAEITDCTD